MAAIEHFNTIKVPASAVFAALTTPEGLGEIWTTELTVKPEPGFINEFHFGKDTDKMKITQLERDKKVEWLCIGSDPEWIGTTISFELLPEGDKTHIRLKQDGWREVNDFFRSCNYHWGWFLYSLKCYCEEGKGIPYQRRKF
jgi:uncharacterized protein YndB with AHSA1/START domain